MAKAASRQSENIFGFALLLALGLLLAGAATALAEPRVALVIGNSAYKGDLPALPNPANDARLMAQTLKTVGFDVVEAEDADQTAMKRAIAEFGKKLTAAGSTATGLFFYAGHGLQVGGENYLIPVDARIETEADVDLVSVSATTVLKQMDFAGSAVNIIVLDACRNNPLSTGARGITRGLAEIKSTPRGSFIAYSTAPGSTAADGDGKNSPYTKALAETITEPGLSISDVFQEVRTKVLAATGQQQTPWDSSSLTGRFYFRPPEASQGETATIAPPQPAPTSAPSAQSAAMTAFQIEQEYWNSIKDSNAPEYYQAYLKKYPNGAYADVARFKLDQAKSAPVPSNGAAGNAIVHDQSKSAAVTFVAQSGVVYAKGGGQVRAAPDGKAALLTKLQTNSEVQATGVSDDGKWWRVTLADGRTGYMHSSVASSQPQPAAAPAQAAAQPPQPDASNGYATQSGGAVATDPNAIQMLDGSAAQQQPVQPPVQQSPAAPPIDPQAANQIAGALQGGNLGGVLSGLLSGAAQQQQAQSAQQAQIVFQPVNQPVTLRAGALIMDAPNGNAIGQVKQVTQLMASGMSPNWLQVQMPDGRLGYVARNWVAR